MNGVGLDDFSESFMAYFFCLNYILFLCPIKWQIYMNYTLNQRIRNTSNLKICMNILICHFTSKYFYQMESTWVYNYSKSPDPIMTEDLTLSENWNLFKVFQLKHPMLKLLNIHSHK